MELDVTDKTFRLKGRDLYIIKGLARRTVKNKKNAAEKAGWTYVTTTQWVDKSETLTGVDFDNLAKFFFDVLEMTPDEVMNARFGDLFDLVPKEPVQQEAE